MLHAGLRVGGLLALFLACLGPHLLSRALAGRSRWPRRFLVAAAWIVGARIRIVGEPVRPHSLLICNHVSWMDILVAAAATGCRFVSKDELGHPLVHWLADQNNTLYVRRSHRRGSADQANAIAEALQQPQPLALFPEGTTGPGDQLMAFRSTLLAAVAPAPPAVEVRPVAIDYGAAATEVAWHGEKGKDNVLRILGRRGTLHVVAHLLAALDRSADRKQLAHAARERIVTALAASSSSTAGL